MIYGGSTVTLNFVDGVSGSGITRTPGLVSFSSENPWSFSAGTGVAGKIADTPAACRDEGDNIHDFTFRPTLAPGLGEPFFPFCCRIE